MTIDSENLPNFTVNNNCKMESNRKQVGVRFNLLYNQNLSPQVR